MSALPVIVQRFITSGIVNTPPRSDTSGNVERFYHIMSIVTHVARPCIFCRSLVHPVSVVPETDSTCTVSNVAYNLIWPGGISRASCDPPSVTVNLDMFAKFCCSYAPQFVTARSTRYQGFDICVSCHEMFLSRVTSDYVDDTFVRILQQVNPQIAVDKIPMGSHIGPLIVGNSDAADFYEVNVADIYQRALFQFSSYMDIRSNCSKKRILPAESLFEPDAKRTTRAPEIDSHPKAEDKEQSFSPQTVPYEDKYNQLLEEDLPLEVFEVEMI